jgi:hypothetical protein
MRHRYMGNRLDFFNLKNSQVGFPFQISLLEPGKAWGIPRVEAPVTPDEPDVLDGGDGVEDFGVVDRRLVRRVG